MGRVIDKVDVICEYKADGKVIPMRFRLINEDGVYEAYTIKGYRQIFKQEGLTVRLDIVMRFRRCDRQPVRRFQLRGDQLFQLVIQLGCIGSLRSYIIVRLRAQPYERHFKFDALVYHSCHSLAALLEHFKAVHDRFKRTLFRKCLQLFELVRHAHDELIRCLRRYLEQHDISELTDKLLAEPCEVL